MKELCISIAVVSTILAIVVVFVSLCVNLPVRTRKISPDTYRKELVCSIDCSASCDHRWVEGPIQTCWAINATTPLVECIGDPHCCQYDDDKCVNTIFTPLCVASCSIHTILYTRVQVAYPWLMGGGQTTKSLRVDCGPVLQACQVPRVMRWTGYHLNLPFFIVIMVCATASVVSVVTLVRICNKPKAPNCEILCVSSEDPFRDNL